MMSRSSRQLIRLASHRTSAGRHRGELRFPFPIIVTAMLYWLGQIAVGTEPKVATLFSGAVFFGLYGISAAGGLRTVPGFLNFIVLTRMLLVGIALKIFTGQAIDSHLRSPVMTATVMALGFAGLCAGSWFYRELPHPRGIIRPVTDVETYLGLGVVFSVLTLASSALVILNSNSVSIELTGGYWGVVQYLATLKAFSLVLAMYYVWAQGCSRFMSHPLVVGLLVFEVALGIAGVTKQGIMEPIVCYLFVGIVRYGWRSRAVWAVAAGASIGYLTIVYPYSQYVRIHGGREGSFSSRLAAIKEVFFDIASNSQYREQVESQVIQDYGWLDRRALTPLNRLALVGDASHLIDATATSQSYTGWYTITLGFKMAVPSFLMHNKPTSSGGNYLGHIAGDVAEGDISTQISYGLMANFYNAFGLRGVFIGSIVLFCAFYYMLRFWFQEARLNRGPYGSTVWFIFLILCNHHLITEDPVAALIPEVVNLILIAVLVVLARWIIPYIPTTISGPDKPSRAVSAARFRRAIVP